MNYAEQANAMQMMNQLLVTTASQAAIDSLFDVDGTGIYEREETDRILG
ncbi:MAG TPA: hypothetical protein VFW05_15820 [Verrucomicrobiae bacterium]|nr:hypothetical protein [Verrucomicrobiae bacterium]